MGGFVDRFLGLVVHVVNHTARAKSIRLSAADRDDLCGEVFLAIVKNDFALLRNFRGKSSLATYLTVVARRIVVREMLARMSAAQPIDASSPQVAESVADRRASAEDRLSDREEVERLLGGLRGHRGRGRSHVPPRWQELPRDQRRGRYARKQHWPDSYSCPQQDAACRRQWQLRREPTCLANGRDLSKDVPKSDGLLAGGGLRYIGLPPRVSKRMWTMRLPPAPALVLRIVATVLAQPHDRATGDDLRNGRYVSEDGRRSCR